jgi:5-methylcytosine-specific restriction enzyme A
MDDAVSAWNLRKLRMAHAPRPHQHERRSVAPLALLDRQRLASRATRYDGRHGTARLPVAREGDLMAWAKGSSRNLPPDWKTRTVPRILKRDGRQCTARLSDGTRCPQTTKLQVDHIGSRDDHHDGNLRTLCEWHHDRKTAAQGNKARKRVTQARPAERHPGLV